MPDTTSPQTARTTLVDDLDASRPQAVAGAPIDDDLEPDSLPPIAFEDDEEDACLDDDDDGDIDIDIDEDDEDDDDFFDEDLENDLVDELDDEDEGEVD